MSHLQRQRKHSSSLIVAALVTVILLATVLDSAAIERPVEERYPDYWAIVEGAGTSTADLDLYYEVAEDIERLSRDLSDAPTVAGVWVEWDPLEVHVATTARPSASVLGVVRNFNRPELLRVDTSRSTDLNHQEEQLDSIMAHQAASDILTFDGDIDVRTGEIVLTVEPGNRRHVVERLKAVGVVEESEGALRTDRRIGRAGRSNVRVDEGELSEPAYLGGGSMSSCTAGFVVRRSGSSHHGIVTAGHGACGQPVTFQGQTTTVAYRNLDYRQDMSVHRVTNGTPENRINISTSPWSRTITSRHTWANMSVGDPVCKNGKVTGYACGNISSKTYRPNWVLNGERFVRISTSCTSGDSGGPHFLSNRAYGITAGGSSSTCVFGAIDYQMQGSGWYVLIN